MLGTNAGFDEFVLHVDAVCNVDTEHQSLPTLAIFVPVGNDVADQIITVHPIGKLVDDIIALPGLDAFQIRIGRGVVDRRHQILLLYQLRYLWTFDDFAKVIAQPAPIRPTWCCARTEEACVRIRFQNHAPSSSGYVMRFVDDDHMRSWEGTLSVRIHRAHRV